ncbi:MAG: threonine synthase [Janthinobacterium lividum]
MHYVSTRSTRTDRAGRDSPAGHVAFSDILLAGLAPDGGLYMPEEYPSVSVRDLTRWRTLPYADLAFEILSRFCDDIPANDLRTLTQRTYTPEVYCHLRDGQRAADITPLRTLGEEAAPSGGTTSLSLLELSNGPTLAFKDMAMQLLGNLFEHVLAKQGASLNILGATSGDTGSAAEYAMRGKQGVRVFMLSPHNKMSPFQRAQMFSLDDPNIFNLALEGVFDDCQDIVKAVSNDHAFKARHRIGTVNSINWARVVAQVVYYFKGYFAATEGQAYAKDGALPEVSFTVPSGNFGNVCAGHIARMMGLPIRRLVVATNENDVLDEFFRTGHYRVRTAAETRQTSSPSMDISKASNFERFVFDLLGRDGDRLTALFRDVESQGGFSLAEGAEFGRIADFGFASGRSVHQDRLATIRDVFARYSTMIDTHTADGVHVARAHLEAGIPMIVLETAQPVKFGETIREALQQEPERPQAFVGIEALPQHSTVLAADVAQVKDFIAARTGC